MLIWRVIFYIIIRIAKSVNTMFLGLESLCQRQRQLKELDDSVKVVF